MTLILLRIESQLQCIVGLTFITGTKDLMVTTQYTNNNQKTTFICSPESTHYLFIEAILENLPPNHIKSQNVKFKRLFARHFYSRRLGVWKRRTRDLNVSIRNINLAVTQKHTTQQS